MRRDRSLLLRRPADLPQSTGMTETVQRSCPHTGERQAIMAPLISLAALIGPQERKPALRLPLPIKATDVPTLTDLYLDAYAGATSHPETGKPAERISAVFEGAHGTPIPQTCLLTANAEGRITAAIVTTDRALGNDGARTAFIAKLQGGLR
jgi:hypothetical protein